MKTTIEDIAQCTGCSKATVSSILKGGGTSARFSAATREKILNTADTMNYKPIATHNLGFVNSTGPVDHTTVDWMSWISPMLSSAHEEALANDKTLSIFCYSSPELGSEFIGGKTPQIFRRRKIDGLVVSGRLDEKVVSYIAESRLPYILMNISDADAHTVDSVCFDEIFTGMQATRYLLGKGHERILHVSVDWSLGHYSIPMRRRGYEMAMKDAGFEPQTICKVEEEDEQFSARLKEILQGSNRPTAIFTFSETLAVACSRIMGELGIRFPEVALISTGCLSKLLLDLLKISYVELPAAEMGRLAMQMLIRKLSTKAPIPTISLRGEIRELGSV
jgi:DNA-binding LacI/PurR family transcriptional regulator